MFYIVPKDFSVIAAHALSFNNLESAKKKALDLKEERRCNYDVIEAKTVWTTQTTDNTDKKLD